MQSQKFGENPRIHSRKILVKIKLQESGYGFILFLLKDSWNNYSYFFCECDFVKPFWLEIDNIFHLNTEFDCQLSNFENIFGIFDNKFLTYIILCTKYFIYRCKFQDKKLHINGLKSFIKSQREIEYCIAKKKGKLSPHFKGALDNILKFYFWLNFIYHLKCNC